MENNKNQRIVLPAETGKIVSKILSKYGLSETTEESFEKIKNGKVSRQVKTIETARDFIRNIISENDAITQLKNGLEVSGEIAKNIIEDIKKEIAPFAEKIIIGEIINNKEEPLSFVKEKPQISVEENEKLITKKERTSNIKIPLKKPTRQKKSLENIESAEKTPSPPLQKKSSGPDRYREPIG